MIQSFPVQAKSSNHGTGVLAPQVLSAGATLLWVLVAAGLVARLERGLPLLPAVHNMWLAIHLATVVPALPLGAWLLGRRKGDHAHRMLGRIWASLMMVTALSSFGLHDMTGGLSPIHILSVITIVALVVSVRAAMRGDIRVHQRAISRLFISLVLAGIATFIPGRLMFDWLVG
jgi:uncharacterized membrane protein